MSPELTNWNDIGLGTFSLHYLRNREKEEIDFFITKNNHPFLLIETKLSDTNISKTLKKFQHIFNVPGVQLVNQPGVCKLVSNDDMKILVISADQWLSLLP